MPGKKRAAAAAPAAAPAAKKAKGARPKVDSAYSGGGQVYGEGGEWWDCMLNQTNVGANNNKYYVIQIIESGGKYTTWTHWGRVGEPGQNGALCQGAGLEEAKKQFKSKFKSKSGNDWDKRANFKPAPGRYTLIEMDHAEDKSPKKAKAEAKGSGAKSKLPASLQSTIQLIFNEDMFKDSMKQLGVDTDKMPLGKLSKQQVQKGVKILEQIEAAVDSGKKAKLGELTSAYYTAIPHNFGRKAPPVLGSMPAVQKEYDMCTVLGDIQTALTTSGKGGGGNPDDANYKALGSKLTPVDPKSKEFKVIDKYVESTRSSSWCKVKLVDVFAVDRGGEGARFAKHASTKNRRLLWHGTNVAVVVAILKTGLRIMEHSGGRVGRGIYLASENSKSAGYVGATTVAGKKRHGYMFLVEAALGAEHEIKRDDHRLKKAPAGFDSIIARGHKEPDPSKDTTLTFDGKKVTVPQGKPIAQPKWKDSSFSQSEYLLYKESQARIRYLLRLEGNW